MTFSHSVLKFLSSLPMANVITLVHSVGDYARLHGLRQSDLAVCAELQISKRAVSEVVHTVSDDLFGKVRHSASVHLFDKDGFTTVAQKTSLGAAVVSGMDT